MVDRKLVARFPNDHISTVYIRHSVIWQIVTLNAHSRNLVFGVRSICYSCLHKKRICKKVNALIIDQIRIYLLRICDQQRFLRVVELYIPDNIHIPALIA